MSYILDALKKSDTERSVTNIPRLGTARSRAHASPSSSHWLSILIGIAIGLLLFTAALLWLNRDRLPVSPASSSTGDQAQTVSQRPAASEPQPAPGDDRSQVVSAEQPAALPASSAVTAAAVPATTVELPTPTPTTTTPPARTSAPQAAPINTREVKIDELPRASPPPSQSLTQTAALPRAPRAEPSVDTLTPEIANRMPPMTVNVVSYSSNPSQRFVMLNQAIYREGDHAGDGVYIEEITADGAIVNFEAGRYLVTPK